LQFTPRNHLHHLGKNCFDFHCFNHEIGGVFLVVRAAESQPDERSMLNAKKALQALISPSGSVKVYGAFKCEVRTGMASNFV
jgi:hypothetical protein